MDELNPVPSKLKGDIAYNDWITWNPLPSGSLQGLRNDTIRFIRYGAIIIRPVIASNPIIASLIKNLRLGPDTYINTDRVNIITIIVPKSGSNIISNANISIIVNNGSNPVLIFFTILSLELRYFDVYIIKPSLANSLGCIPSGPIPNQLRDPLRTLPIPGIKTSTRRMKQINNILFEFFFMKLISILVIIYINIKPIIKNSNWFFINLYGSLYLYSDHILDAEYIINKPNIDNISTDIRSFLSIFIVSPILSL